MDGAYISLFLIFFIIIIASLESNAISLKTARKRRKGVKKFMSPEIISKLVGRYCTITTTSFATSVTGQIVSINDNWIELATKKGPQFLNCDFIVDIKPKNQ